MEKHFPSFADDDQRAVAAVQCPDAEHVRTEVTPVELTSVGTADVLPLRIAGVAALRPEGEARLPKLRSARRAHNDAFERAYLLAALEATNQNVTRAAKLAGVSRQQIQRLMIKHRVRRGEPVPRAQAASGTSA